MAKKLIDKKRRVLDLPMDGGNVMLSLSKEASSVLYRVLWRVGGDPNGPRGLVDEILEELRRIGVETTHTYTLVGNVSLNE